MREGMDTDSHKRYLTVLIQYDDKNIFAETCYFGALPAVLISMGLVITPLATPRRFNPPGAVVGGLAEIGRAGVGLAF